MTNEEAIAELNHYIHSDSLTEAPSNEACQLAIDALKNEPGWMPIDNNPMTTGSYLVVCNEWIGNRASICSVRICSYFYEADKWFENGKDITAIVTHWLPLPEPPKEETK